MTKMIMTDQNELFEWITLLHDRFKQSTNVAMNSLIHQRYIIRDAVDQREPRKYVQKVIRLAKDVDMINVLNQLNLIYNDIDIEIRFDTLRRSRKRATINDMLNDLNEYKHEWWTKTARLRDNNNTDSSNRNQLFRQDAKSFNQFDQYSIDSCQQQRSSFQSQSQSQFRYQSNAYQNYQYIQQPRQSYQQQLKYQQSDYRPTEYQQQKYQPNDYSQSDQFSNARALSTSSNQPTSSNRLQIIVSSDAAFSSS